MKRILQPRYSRAERNLQPRNLELEKKFCFGDESFLKLKSRRRSSTRKQKTTQPQKLRTKDSFDLPTQNSEFGKKTTSNLKTENSKLGKRTTSKLENSKRSSLSTMKVQKTTFNLETKKLETRKEGNF